MVGSNGDDYVKAGRRSLSDAKREHQGESREEEEEGRRHSYFHGNELVGVSDQLDYAVAYAEVDERIQRAASRDAVW